MYIEIWIYMDLYGFIWIYMDLYYRKPKILVEKWDTWKLRGVYIL